jgi:hypothetical protein
LYQLIICNSKVNIVSKFLSLQHEALQFFDRKVLAEPDSARIAATFLRGNGLYGLLV